MEILKENKIEDILQTLLEKGIEKINFAGGEPLLHPRLNQMLSISKRLGMTTSIVTNGFFLTPQKINELSNIVDWIGISVDSSDDEIERFLGRGFGNHVTHTREIVPHIHSQGIKLKINTVVTLANYCEDMKPLIQELNPQRWKVFQYLHMKGINDKYDSQMRISLEEFHQFVLKNQDLILMNGEKPVFETNDDMLEAYLMISPDGQLTIDSGGVYRKIDWVRFCDNSIESFIDKEKYKSRGGEYVWG